MSKQPKDMLVADVLLRIEKSISNIGEDVDDMRKSINSLSITAGKQQVILEEHIRRTEVNEQALKLMEEGHERELDNLNSRVLPLEKHTAMWAGAAKVGAVLVAIITLAITIYNALWQ